MIVSILLAALIAFSAALKLTHRPKVVASYRTAGVPETWLNRLATLLLTAAVGLVVGIWWPIAGLAAAAGLVAYFVFAVGFHIRANDTAHAVTPIVLAGISAAVILLQVAAL